MVTTIFSGLVYKNITWRKFQVTLSSVVADFSSKTVVENVNFWRPDPRGNDYRVHIQKLCYEAMETRLRLNDAEKRALVQATDCNMEDAYKFCKYPDIAVVKPLTICQGTGWRRIAPLIMQWKLASRYWRDSNVRVS